MKVLVITQARYGSTRLPAKVLKEVNGETLLELHLRRILLAKNITKLKVATTTEEGADKIVEIAQKIGVETHKGSIDDVLERFYYTALPENPDYVVRVTSDCPLIDPTEIDKIIDMSAIRFIYRLKRQHISFLQPRDYFLCYFHFSEFETLSLS